MSAHELTQERAARGVRVPSWWYDPSKRVLDVCVALVVLVVFAPLWLAIALAVRLSSPGPVLFRRDDVVGKDGRTFTIFKFRTMYDQCDQTPHLQALARFVAGEASTVGEDRAAVFKVVNDERVTSVGRWLRRSGLDEIPQFLNVLRGEMSIVGPRPSIETECAAYTDQQRRRLSVRPGITGLYQTTARGRAPLSEMIRIDLEYIDRRSLWLDVTIMVRTVPVMLTGRGSF
jgi:lipopolysaccharide/colanic/teichoic acid biosynthesis glycosyltransferase